MSTCPRPEIVFPCRVPIKVIGKAGVFDPERALGIIRAVLGPQAESEQGLLSKAKGAYISYTFWVLLPDEHAERPLREEFQKLPGYVMQL